MENAKFKLGADCIEISGPQAYVEEQLNQFKNLIESSYEKILNQPVTTNTPRTSTGISKTTLIAPAMLSKHTAEDAEFIEVKTGEIKDFDNVVTIQGDTIQINCDIPGNTTSSKMINFILIYMWAKLKQGVDSVPYSELRERGQHYIEFDTTNLAKYMERHRKYFLIMGDKRNKIAKLIRPGIKEAERLVSDLIKA